MVKLMRPGQERTVMLRVRASENDYRSGSSPFGTASSGPVLIRRGRRVRQPVLGTALGVGVLGLGGGPGRSISAVLSEDRERTKKKLVLHHQHRSLDRVQCCSGVTLRWHERR